MRAGVHVTLCSLLLAVTCCLGQRPCPSSDPLHDIDCLFVPAYTTRVTALKAENPPYIEAFGSSLSLYLHGHPPLSIRVLGDPYHHLKDVAHVPFTVYLTLKGDNGGVLSEKQLTPVRTLLTKLTAGLDGLSYAGFNPAQEERQRKILDDSIGFLQGVLAHKNVDQVALHQFARAMAPLLLADADDAGCLQVEATHHQMMLWKPLLSNQEWDSLRVVIKNSHQARYRNVDTQYFAWLFGGTSPAWSLSGEGSRVVYAETLFGTETDADELLSVVLDFDASRTFFGNEWRMSEDFLSEGAARCIARLDPSDKLWTPGSTKANVRNP